MDTVSYSPFDRKKLSRRHFVVVSAAAATAGLGAFGQSPQDRDSYSTIEFRQYTLHRDKRDTLISLFEQKFIEPQNVAGAHVIGSFRDVDDPDRFVWIRGFRDMSARQRALQAFYDNPVWKQEKAAVNATIVDSDNVFLLRATAPLVMASAVSAQKVTTGIYGSLTFYLGDVPASQFADFFDRSMATQFTEWGASPGITLLTEQAPNNFPRLPVREHDPVFIWLARWANMQLFDGFISQFRAWSGWRDPAPLAVLPALMRKPEILRLTPTSLSELR